MLDDGNEVLMPNFSYLEIRSCDMVIIYKLQ
jgi:hypothetical protein